MDTSPIEIVRMHRGNALACTAMPYVVARIAKFCAEVEPQARPNELADQVWRFFGAGDPRLGLWIGVQNQRIVGHVLCQPEPVHFDQGPWDYMLVRQALVDRRIAAGNESKEVFNMLREYTKKLGISRIMMLTHRKTDVMARRWGFTFRKALMDLEV